MEGREPKSVSSKGTGTREHLGNFDSVVKKIREAKMGDAFEAVGRKLSGRTSVSHFKNLFLTHA